MSYIDDIIMQSNLDPKVVDKDLEKLRKQAKKFAELIKDNYVIPSGKRHLVVYKDRYSNDIERVIRCGVDVIWNACYSGEEYFVNCNEEEIYNLLLDEYIFKEKVRRTKYYQDQAETALLFKIFINRTANVFAL